MKTIEMTKLPKFRLRYYIFAWDIFKLCNLYLFMREIAVALLSSGEWKYSKIIGLNFLKG